MTGFLRYFHNGTNVVRKGKPNIGSNPDPGRPTAFGLLLPVPGVTCGLLNESILTPYNASNAGTVTIPDGTDLSNKIVYGDLIFPAVMNLGITGTNVLFRGSTQTLTGDRGIIQGLTVRSGSNPIPEFSDFEIRPQAPHAYRQGIRGHRITAKRGYIHHVVDGLSTIAPTSGNSAGRADVTMQGCYLTDNYFTRPDPQHAPGGSHCDGWQHHSGTNALIEGNYFEGKLSLAPGTTVEDGRVEGDWGGSGIVWQVATGGTPSDATVIFRKNWLKGYSAMMYLHPNITGTMEDNRFSRETWNQYWIRKSPGAATWDGLDGVGGNRGNVWWDGPTAGALLTTPRLSGIEQQV